MRQSWITKAKNILTAGGGLSVKRDIKDFKGSILNLGGTESELRRYARYHDQLQLQDKVDFINDIYTVNVDPSSGADVIGRMDSISDMQCLPSNRFDVVYFSKIPTQLIDMKNALAIASRVLTDDGIMLFCGGVELVQYDPHSQSINPTIETEQGRRSIDMPSLIAAAGFKSGTYMKDQDVDNGVFKTRPATGSDIIAYKSNTPVGLKEMYGKAPALKYIFTDMFHRSADDFSERVQTSASSSNEESSPPKLSM